MSADDIVGEAADGRRGAKKVIGVVLAADSSLDQPMAESSACDSDGELPDSGDDCLAAAAADSCHCRAS